MNGCCEQPVSLVEAKNGVIAFFMLHYFNIIKKSNIILQTIKRKPALSDHTAQ